MTARLLDMTPQQLRRAVEAAGEKPYRAGQLIDWVYRKGATEAARMTNLPAALTGQFEILTSHVVGRTDSDDGCIKLLIELHDGRRIETVLIPDRNHTTVCLSTQVGCAMGCTFCASGMDGLQRNLASGEILEQFLHLWHESALRPTNVVFMGMGEPLANYDATVTAARAVIDPERLAISARKVTISTTGPPRQIRRLAREDMPVTLAISLHAADDELRKRLIPAAANYTVQQLLDAAAEFFKSRKREVTLEYVLLAGVNDSLDQAKSLAAAAGRVRCNVNLILYNPVRGLPYDRPAVRVVKSFADTLKDMGVNVHMRRSRGLDGDAACGQLRRRRQK